MERGRRETGRRGGPGRPPERRLEGAGVEAGAHLKARQCFCCLSVISKVRSLQQYRW